MTVVRDWCESLWGKKSGYVHYGHVPDAPAFLPDHGRSTNRMPTAETKNRLIERDGHHCRFCGIPVIRREVRERIRRTYPEAKLWGRTNAEQHAAFQTMWLQFGHLVPHSRGGASDEKNMLITCAPCNYARVEHTPAEVGLADPRARPVQRSTWDGLERFR